MFIVHGRESETKHQVARTLDKLRLNPVILNEQANSGKTIIEKLEAEGDVGFAVVILTPDDFGSLQGDEPKPRARQNVILELGYFIGRLGRNRVCILSEGSVEEPSDISGVMYTSLAGGWQLELARELASAGYDIDMNCLR